MQNNISSYITKYIKQILYKADVSIILLKSCLESNHTAAR